MKLSEYRGADALDLLAEIIDPVAKILADQEIWRIAQKGRAIDGVKYGIKNYKNEIIEILAAMDGVPADEYKCNIFTLPMKVMEIINDKEMQDFFTSQFQMMEETSFGTATENTEETETM
jgi:hypothetical protein